MIIDAIIQVSFKDKAFLLDDFMSGKSIVELQCECLCSFDFVRHVYVLMPEDEGHIDVQERLLQPKVSCLYGSVENIAERYRSFLSVSDCDVILRLTGDAVCLDYDAIQRAYELFCAEKVDLVQPWGYPQGICGEIMSTTALKKVLQLADSSIHPLYYMLDHAHEFKIVKNKAPKELFRPDIDVRVQCAGTIAFAREQYQSFISGGLDGVINEYDEMITTQVVTPYQELFRYSGEEKNILFVTHSPNMGGSEFSLLSLAREIDGEYAVYVGVGGEGGNVVSHVEHHGIATVRMDVPVYDRVSEYSAVEIASITQVLRDHAIGMIYANSRYALMLAGLIARMDTDIMIIGHVRDLCLTPTAVAQMALGRFDKIYANSKAVKDVLCACGLERSQITLMYNWLDDSSFFPDARLGAQFVKQHDLNQDGLRFGYAGQIVEWKGIEDLVVALGQLKRSGYAFSCCIAGTALDEDTTYEEYIRSLITEEDLSRNVHMLGFVADMNAFYNGIDVLIVPSHQEPFGRVVMEAMAVGVAVVGTRCGGIPEMIKDNEDGILVDAYDPCQIAQALIRCYDQDVCVQLGETARKKIASLFNKETLIKEWRESLQGIYVS